MKRHYRIARRIGLGIALGLIALPALPAVPAALTGSGITLFGKTRPV
jgi:hypothetical protein